MRGKRLGPGGRGNGLFFAVVSRYMQYTATAPRKASRDVKSNMVGREQVSKKGMWIVGVGAKDHTGPSGFIFYLTVIPKPRLTANSTEILSYEYAGTVIR